MVVHKRKKEKEKNEKKKERGVCEGRHIGSFCSLRPMLLCLVIAHKPSGAIIEVSSGDSPVS